MAMQFHTRVSLPCQARLLPATAPLRERTKSCFSLPFQARCSRLRVQCAGISTVVEFEAQSVKTPAKCDERELPPLFASLNIPGLPPCRQSIYVDEASALITKRWPYQWLQPYYYLWNSMASFAHPSAVSCDHLAAISSTYVLAVALDDIFFDEEHDFLQEKNGLDPNILGNPRMIQEYLHSLCDLLLREEPPQNMTSIQEMTWELGCDFRKLSNQKGFDKLFADALKDYFNSSSESHEADVEGDGKYVMDLENYTKMRIRNGGGIFTSLAVELGNSISLPAEIRQDPVVQQLILCSAIHVGYVNDIFSYCREQDEPHNPRNLIKVLMASEGMELPDAAWKAVNLTNSVVEQFMELEKQLPVWEDETKALIVQRYVEGLKELMSGNLYFYTLAKRYRHPKAVFPELRDLDAPIG